MNIGASIIRTGCLGILCHTYDKEPRGLNIFRIGFWAHYTILMIRNLPKIELVIVQAPIVGFTERS